MTARLTKIPLTKAGARLVRTGDSSRSQVLAWCRDNGLSARQTDWVLIGALDERKRERQYGPQTHGERLTELGRSRR
jgi:hypothetical protein